MARIARCGHANVTASVLLLAATAPANMNLRSGLLPDMTKPGPKIAAIGSPRKDDPRVFLLRRVVLTDGREFSSTSN